MEQETILRRVIMVIESLILKGDIDSKSKFAKEAGLSPQHLNEILKGRTKIPLDLIALLNENYQINTEYLLVGKGKIFKYDPIPRTSMKMSSPEKNPKKLRDEDLEMKFFSDQKSERPDFMNRMYSSKKEKTYSDENRDSNEIDNLITEILHLKTKNYLLEKQLQLQEDLIKEYKRRLGEID